MSLSKTLYQLLSNDSIQEDSKLSQDDWKIVDWDVKHPYKQFKSTTDFYYNGF